MCVTYYSKFKFIRTFLVLLALIYSGVQKILLTAEIVIKLCNCSNYTYYQILEARVTTPKHSLGDAEYNFIYVIYYTVVDSSQVLSIFISKYFI